MSSRRGRPILSKLFQRKPDSGPPDRPPGSIPTKQLFPAWERFVRIAWVIAGIVAVVLGGSVWWKLSRPEFEAVRFPEPTPVLTEAGLHVAPAVSSDGKVVVIASDRGRNDYLSLWLLTDQPPRRVTSTKEEETEPDLSPDGREVVFRLLRDGGGVYRAPLDGSRPPAKLADGGWRPRYSPSGNSVTFFRTDGPDSTYSYGRIFVVDRDGGNVRQVAPTFKVARHPVWIDEQHLVFEGSDATGVADWWVADLASPGQPVRTEAFRILTSSFGKRSSPDNWARGGVLFSASSAASLNVWHLPLDPVTWRAGQPRRLTDGKQGEIRPVAAGEDLIYITPNRTTDVWQASIDADRGVVTSALQPLTNLQAQTALPTISADGSRLAYLSNRTGAWELWTRAGDREHRLSSFREIGYRPVLSPDGRRVAVPLSEDEDCAIDIADLDKVGTDSMVDGCFHLWDWSPVGGQMLVFNPLRQTRTVELLEGHGATRPILSHPTHGVYAARFSADGKWLAFLAGPSGMDAPAYVAPYTGKVVPPTQWIPIPESAGGVPAWAPGGRLVFVRSNRDGYACLWAQPLDERKRPSGDAFPVMHFHRTAFGIAPLSFQEMGLSVTANKLVLNLAKDTATVWRAKFP